MSLQKQDPRWWIRRIAHELWECILRDDIGNCAGTPIAPHDKTHGTQACWHQSQQFPAVLSKEGGQLKRAPNTREVPRRPQNGEGLGIVEEIRQAKNPLFSFLWSSCCEMQSLSRNTSLGPQSNALIRCQKKSRPTKTTYPGMARHQASHGNIIAGTMHTQQVKHEATAAARELKSTSMVRSFCQRDVP